MAGRGGLNDSIWATGTGGRNPNYSNVQRAGDWGCPSCKFSNFQWRNECYRCQSPKLQTNARNHGNGTGANATPVNTSRSEDEMDIIGGSGQAVGRSDGLWSSNEARRTNGLSTEASATYGGRSGYSKPGMLDEWSSLDVTGGLALSRWAPRNASRQASREVWTRTAPIPVPMSQPPSRPPSPPDLGLPYEVQHYILSMMERILEEGCYDFASRWVPSMLHDKGWTCSEAVELSAWKKFLPTAIPSHALHNDNSRSYSLESGLTDAVRVRNSAVHRHLCDNKEIRIMTMKSQQLMEMLGDRSRREKFARLREELSRWDAGSRNDRDAARGRLEDALREIGERDMDDMDWTPNAVSLHEIKEDVDVRVSEVEYADAMELD